MTPSEAVVARLQMVECIRREMHKRQSSLNENARWVGALEIESLTKAELFVWSQPMTEAVFEASHTLPSPVTLNADLAPCNVGLFFFERPLTMRGVGHPVSGLMWFRENGSIMVYPYTPSTTRGTYLGPHLACANFLALEGSDVDTLGRQSASDIREFSTSADFDMPTGVPSVMRFLLSGWLWMNQRLLQSERVACDRPARKLSERADLPSLVNVVRLRRTFSRPEHSIQSVEAHEWSCQWIVRGHWRQQYYPSTGSHRPKFIEPYAKGPEDAPFKVPSPTVFAVNR